MTPSLGLSEISGVTVKFAEAVSMARSVAITFCPPSSPLGTTGTVNVHAVPVVPGKLPDASVEQVEVTASPSNVKLIVESSANPDPVAATELYGASAVGYTTRTPLAVRLNITPEQS